MSLKTVRITAHALHRMRTRYPEWICTDLARATEQMRQMVQRGTPVGGQVQNNLAVEAKLSETLSVYFVGHTSQAAFTVRSVLSREQLLANMGMLALNGPGLAPGRQRYQKRRAKKTYRYQREQQARDEDREDRPPRRRKPDPGWDRELG